jgi:hypothetical protein
MAIPSLVLKTAQTVLDDYCKRKFPPAARDEMRLLYTVDGNAVTLYEERPRYNAKPGDPWYRMEIARIRYVVKQGAWLLYCSDRHHRWHRYDLLEPTLEFGVVLAEIERDPTGIFWG